MPQISLTDFIDVVSKSGKTKATAVRKILDRPDYDPAFDFYRAIREHVVNVHKHGQTKKDLQQVMTGLVDLKKIKAYPDVLAGYKTWWGRKKLVWFDPPRSIYSGSGIDITVNPELGLEVNGRRYVIKLYFKDDALRMNRVEIINGLMESQLRGVLEPGDGIGVLDVRKSKLFGNLVDPEELLPLVNAELAYISSMWGA